MKKAGPKIPVPRANPLGRHRQQPGFPRNPAAPRDPALKSRIYTKSAQRTDPTEFMSSGFGDTGMEGEQ